MEKRQNEKVWEERKEYEDAVKCKIAVQYVLSLTSTSRQFFA
jgi:hypothetical protein